MVFEFFNCQSEEAKLVLIPRFFIFGFGCLAKNKEARLLDSCILYLVYSQILVKFFPMDDIFRQKKAKLKIENRKPIDFGVFQ